jgi:hypothetical protein
VIFACLGTLPHIFNTNPALPMAPPLSASDIPPWLSTRAESSRAGVV